MALSNAWKTFFWSESIAHSPKSSRRIPDWESHVETKTAKLTLSVRLAAFVFSRFYHSSSLKEPGYW